MIEFRNPVNGRVVFTRDTFDQFANHFGQRAYDEIKRTGRTVVYIINEKATYNLVAINIYGPTQ